MYHLARPRFSLFLQPFYIQNDFSFHSYWNFLLIRYYLWYIFYESITDGDKTEIVSRFFCCSLYCRLSMIHFEIVMRFLWHSSLNKCLLLLKLFGPRRQWRCVLYAIIFCLLPSTDQVFFPDNSTSIVW